jgi:hypothetical protein
MYLCTQEIDQNRPKGQNSHLGMTQKVNPKYLGEVDGIMLQKFTPKGKAQQNQTAQQWRRQNFSLGWASMGITFPVPSHFLSLLLPFLPSIFHWNSSLLSPFFPSSNGVWGKITYARR